ncbi:hypothetical protein [Streptomyces sp. S.PNR 29]|uniref:hypothetical protein n=1 Tax=Streptomyces sp. S.PNR 29 TaxID=2973805 RepID=UPI0025AFF3F7|nr:hypothetical protein [Streptomyces sp. S.PNR 29]MDN0194155.1 hypothetical protein [Streptomyces sp. S.PNR 29]
MRPELPVRTRSAVVAASVGTLISAAALVAALAPVAAAAPAPLPVPAAGPESLVTEGVSVEGPLVNNVSLPTGK